MTCVADHLAECTDHAAVPAFLARGGPLIGRVIVGVVAALLVIFFVAERLVVLVLFVAAHDRFKLGEVVAVDADGFSVVCADGRFKITRVQPDGGKKVDASEFISTAKLAKGAFLT